MIRQAISCDICGTEKKQTNHWFVAYDQGGELRVSGWSSRNRLRTDSKHLCGQTCLHKLVDDFVAKALTARGAQSAQAEAGQESSERAAAVDASLTSNAAYGDVESSARLIPTPAAARPRPAAASRPVTPRPAAPRSTAPRPVESRPVETRPFESRPSLPKPAAAALVRPPLQMPIELLAPSAKPQIEEIPLLAEDAPRFASRNWRAAAWERERERERELRGEHHAGMPVRRRFSS